MRVGPFLFVFLASLLVTPVAGTAQTASSEHTIRLDEGASSPPATIGEMGWLAGYWRGEGLGGSCEELWGQPLSDRMYGTFTLSRDEGVVFSESMLLVQEEGSLVLKLRHYTADFIAWEDKEDYVSFPLVRIGEREAWFNGLTFRRLSDDSLSVYLVLHSEGEATEHEFRFERVPL